MKFSIWPIYQYWLIGFVGRHFDGFLWEFLCFLESTYCKWREKSFSFSKKLHFSFIEKLKHYKKSRSTTNSNQHEVSISWNVQNKKFTHEKKMNQHIKSLLKIKDEPMHKKSFKRKRWINTQKNRLWKKFN